MKMNNEYQNADDSPTDTGALGRKLQRRAGIFTNCIKALVQFLIWLVVGIASLAGAYAAIRIMLVGVKLILNAFGI